MAALNSNNGQLLYKASAVAQMLNITAPTLKKLVLTGKIDCVTINGRRYFTQEAINRYIEENTKFGK